MINRHDGRMGGLLGEQRTRYVRFVVATLVMVGTLVIVRAILSIYAPVVGDADAGDDTQKPRVRTGQSPPADLCQRIEDAQIRRLLSDEHRWTPSSDQFEDESRAGCTVSDLRGRTVLDARLVNYGDDGEIPAGRRAKKRFVELCASLSSKRPVVLELQEAPAGANDSCVLGKEPTHGAGAKVDLVVLHGTSTLWIQYSAASEDLEAATAVSSSAAIAIYSAD